METQWQEIVDALVEAKRCLASAWQILDGTYGAASGVEPARNACNADVASPAHVQEFWRTHGELPGFAAGT